MHQLTGAWAVDQVVEGGVALLSHHLALLEGQEAVVVLVLVQLLQEQWRPLHLRTQQVRHST
jgi:hypothetical protein